MAASTAEDRALDALTKILESAISPDMLEVQKIILRRLALSGDLFPSRVPAPLNITQVGGYLNLLARDPTLRTQALASALGVAGPNPPLGWKETLPGYFFASRSNDRPPGSSQAATPVLFTIRSDFAVPLDAALKSLHDLGGTLPILSPVRVLPPANGGVAPTELLPFLGRTLQIVPSAALADPTTDPIAVGRLAAGPIQVISRQLDPTAPNAGTVAAQNWSLWSCTAAACSETAVNNGRHIELAAILNAAGWYQTAPLTPPTSSTNAGMWHTFTNVTGLVVGQTSLGQELSLLYGQGEIAQSSLREILDRKWDGTTFGQGA